jgi:hypothetical protein
VDDLQRSTYRPEVGEIAAAAQQLGGKLAGQRCFSYATTRDCGTVETEKEGGATRTPGIYTNRYRPRIRRGWTFGLAYMG